VAVKKFGEDIDNSKVSLFMAHAVYG